MPGNKFDKCFIIVNPYSTNQRRGRRLGRNLEDYFSAAQMQWEEFSFKDHESAVSKINNLAKGWNAKTLVCVAGGDGTVSLVVNTLLRSARIPPEARKAVILPLWGGNANDLAYMINGSAHTINLQRILAEGQIIAVHPLEITMKNEHTESKLAINYVSFGATAYAAKRVNQIDYQRKRLYRTPGIKLLAEAASAVRSISRSQSFRVDIEGRSTKLYDLILINGSRIAKVYRAPNRLTEKTFFELIIRRKHPVLLPYFARVLKALALERNLKTWHNVVIHEPTWAQVDGEVVRLEARTEITVRPHTRPFYAISTKLKN